MSRRAARVLFAGFFLAYTIALTYPGVLPFNRVRPFVLGLPFSFFWVVLWVVLGLIVFVVVERIESSPSQDAPPGRTGGTR